MVSVAQARILALVTLIVLFLLSGTLVSSPLQAETFADQAFQQVWERSDKAVAEQQVARTWLWGPQPNTTGLQEDYAEAPGGQRLVQYFDKSRMEITNPAGDKSSRWYVTNGLLTVELVTGRQQVGDNSFVDGFPSQVPVAGDPNNPGPTYASFTRLIQSKAEARTGSVTESVDRAGTVSNNASAEAAKLAQYAYYEPATGHNVPDVFWNWMQKLDEQWLFAMGYPISEPYWAKFIVAGQERELLVQLFQRRVLTYNPANSAQWQVEMGNIGQHYYAWRYASQPPSTTPGSPIPNQSGPTPTPVSSSGATATPTPASGAATTPTATPTLGSGATATPTPTSGPGATPTPTPVSGLTLNEQEQQFVQLLNQYRSQNNLPTLRVDTNLQKAARFLSEDMAKYNYFGHIDSQSRDYPKRLTDFGYTATPVNEIIAAGMQAQAAFDIWKNSPGNNAIMLNPDYKAVGPGYAFSASATYQHYWTATFGGQ